MKKKYSLKSIYRAHLVIYIIFIAMFLSMIILMSCHFNEIIIQLKMPKTLAICAIIGVLLLLFSGTVSAVKQTVILFKDYKDVVHNNYITVTATDVRFAKNINPDTGIQMNNKPVIRDIQSNEEITVFTNDEIDIGETYKFNYIKNCKLAEVVEKVSPHTHFVDGQVSGE